MSHNNPQPQYRMKHVQLFENGNKYKKYDKNVRIEFGKS